MARRQIPAERKTLYYIGMGVSLVGLLMFLSTLYDFSIALRRFHRFQRAGEV